MIYERMLSESKKIEQQIRGIQRQLDKLPEGKIVCSHSGKYSKWFLSDGKSQIYLPKKERPLAEKLAYKKYLTLQLKNLKREKTAINFYLRHHDIDAQQKETSFFNSIEYKDLLAPYFKPKTKELREWAISPYEKNEKYPEHLIHKSISGRLVRSKSEAIIDMVLYKYKIPFRYECGLQLGETLVYPDFTIRHPRTGETYYWEHFGLIDDFNYSRSAFSKLQLYTSCGIYPTFQLITTYETKENPLSIENVEKIVKDYFL